MAPASKFSQVIWGSNRDKRFAIYTKVFMVFFTGYACYYVYEIRRRMDIADAKYTAEQQQKKLKITAEQQH